MRKSHQWKDKTFSCDYISPQYLVIVFAKCLYVNNNKTETMVHTKIEGLFSICFLSINININNSI